MIAYDRQETKQTMQTDIDICISYLKHYLSFNGFRNFQKKRYVDRSYLLS